MKQLTLISFCAVAIFACSKQNSVNPYADNLPIASTSSPAFVTAGQDIVSKVTCELPSISSDVIFKGFDILQTFPHHYSIHAKAEYKNQRNTALDVIWRMDTISVIKTTSPGWYVLNFYDAANLVKSDTVQVR